MASDLLTKGAAWMANQFAGSAAHAVTYTRGATSVTISATVGRTVFRYVQEGVWLRTESRDYLCDPAGLTGLGLPQDGDRISEEVDGVTTTYEVMAPGGEPSWRWSGPTRDRVRIHTQRISATA
jgi:hypothetical protein